MKKILLSILVFAALVMPSVPASAHVRLDPSTAVVGRQSYNLRVPNEKEIATTQVRLVVPDTVEVTGVAPIAGWTHTEKKTKAEATQKGQQSPADDTDQEPVTERITEITWSGGEIKAGEYMNFSFATNYTANPSEVKWKAYQTYSDGSVVPWDGSSEEAEAPTVKITAESPLDTVNKTVADLSKEVATKQSSGFEPDVNTWLAGAALVVSVVALLFTLKDRQNKQN